MTIEVVDAGPLTSVQDVFGRRPWRRFGVPFGGAADPWSARLANRLAGNPDGAPVLEVIGQATFRADARVVVAVAGGLRADVDGIPLPADSALALTSRSRLRMTAEWGLRGYLAVAGGFAVPAVLGSAATDLRTGFGGWEGRALRAGDRLPIGSPTAGRPQRWGGRRADGPLRVMRGPQTHEGSMEALTGSAWSVGQAVDRTGVRLEGSIRLGGGEVPSQGVLPGAVQVPPDGAPILMLADCPVTGGYRVPACVIAADVGRVAQLRPGDPVRLTEVGPDEAREAWLRSDHELHRLEPVERGDEGAAWAGALD